MSDKRKFEETDASTSSAVPHTPPKKKPEPCSVCEAYHMSHHQNHLNSVDSRKCLCVGCEKVFDGENDLASNVDVSPPPPPPPLSTPSNKNLEHCSVCDVDVSNLHTHQRSLMHKNKVCCEHDDKVMVIKTAYKNHIATYRVFATESDLLTPEQFMNDAKKRVLRLIESKQNQLQNSVKVNFELYAVYTKAVIGGEEGDAKIQEIKSFNTKNRVIGLGDDIPDTYDIFSCEIKSKSEEFQEEGSGWAIEHVCHLEVGINKYSPIKGSSYIPLPKWIRVKNACINVHNDDDACFAWAVVSALFPAMKHGDRVTSYPHFKDKLNLEGISFPMSLKEIKIFEQNNDISVNVYKVCDKTISSPVHLMSRKREKHVNLLLFEQGDSSHFCWIKDLSRLIGSQISKHRCKSWVCDSCFLTFSTEEKRKEHTTRDCSQIKTTMPAPGRNKLNFQNYCNKIKTPVVVYADFEAVLKPIATCSPSASSSSTTDYQMHEPHSYGYYIKCDYDDSRSRYVTYRGEQCAEKFLKSLECELKPFIETLNNKLPMNPLNEEQEYSFSSAVKCHICGKELDGVRVRDHCHLTGEFRGAAHKRCNLNYQITKEIPIVFHNLSKYDAHFIIKTLDGYKPTIIPINKETFISFTITIKSCGSKINLRFVDSFRFLPSGLDKLVSNLESEQFNAVKKHFPEHTHLVTKKGVFPYDYVESLEKLEESSLPSVEGFFNKLSNRGISDCDYDHAQNVWSTFNIKTLGEYSDLYLKTDVLLLTDVFENFRRVCHNTYELDPTHYYTAPGLSWDAMLKYTKVEMELFTDISMLKFVQRGIRGGMSQCSGKYAQANNKYMEHYDPTKESKYIMYFDANNQYGWAMSQYLPIKDFRWLDESEVKNFDLKNVQLDSEKGYFIETDLEYPAHLHDLHNDIPFCPELIAPKTSKSKTQKLITSLSDKKEYVIHYVNLKQCLEHGMKLNKIHRILEFSQSPWLKPYIDLNTTMRTKAQNSFEKDFYKLMNNAVFGKTMENLDKRVDVKIINKWESEGKRLGARALTSRPNFHSCTIINENLTIIQMRKDHVKYDKPIYVGFAVLDLSKTLMYEFHYDYMLPKYNQNINLLYTDTDSFIYEIRTEDFFDDIRPDLCAWFDTSDFPVDNIYNIPLVNKKVLGKFKDECSGAMIKEFIGIRSKCYCVVKENDVCIKKIKGIKRSVVADKTTKKEFYDCMNANVVFVKPMNVIRSKAHALYTQTVNKVALSNNDDKRYMIPNSRSKTLAWGHKDIPE